MLESFDVTIVGYVTGKRIAVEQKSRADRVAVVLQRPDFHIYGTGQTIGDAAVLVAHLRGALAAAGTP